MKIRLEHGLVYVEAILTFRGRILPLSNVILDTGSASTIFAAEAAPRSSAKAGILSRPAMLHLVMTPGRPGEVAALC